MRESIEYRDSFKDKSEDEVYIPSATPNVPTPGPDEPEDAFRNAHRN
jgi:hypothetical protein